jgi:hypothetical protein
LVGPVLGGIGASVDNESRGFCSFSLADVPAGAVVISATLRAHQGFSRGIGTNDPVIVDHLDDYGALGDEDFAAQALADNIGTLSATTTEGDKSLAVFSAVTTDLAGGRARSSYRIRFLYGDGGIRGTILRPWQREPAAARDRVSQPLTESRQPPKGHRRLMLPATLDRTEGREVAPARGRRN